MIDPTRVSSLNDAPPRQGRYVLYWMQASQRTICNHALEFAVIEANRLGLPVLVCFGLMDDYPQANERRYFFMLQGLRDVKTALERRGIGFVVRHGAPASVAIELARDAALVVCDRGYLRHQRQWRDGIANGAGCRVWQVESDTVVPVEETSEKPEFAARTIRPRINRKLTRYLTPLKVVPVRYPCQQPVTGADIDVADPDQAIEELKVDRSVGRVRAFEGGQRQAQKRLNQFIAGRLLGYEAVRREPAAEATSHLSPYLHFGQLSPLDVALKVNKSGAAAEDRQAFLEELIVRRELAINFVYHTPQYDRYESLPAWVRKSLDEHRSDKRAFLYNCVELEAATTHDSFWNAAQREMIATGFMQNSMRMYWGKKILEWKATPEEAFADLLYLNNRYFLCGRDPASYANVLWIFGLHDRPWQEREIFGKIRYMNASGLSRKFDMGRYERRVPQMELEAGEPSGEVGRINS